MQRVENFKQALQLLCAGMQLYWIDSMHHIWTVKIDNDKQFQYTKWKANTNDIYSEKMIPLEGYSTINISFADKELYIY